MEMIFNKYFIIDDMVLFWAYVILIIVMIAMTVFFVNKELRNKK